MASRCSECSFYSFPPRADCPECLSGEFAYEEISGRGTIHTYSTIAAAPTGFDDEVPYTVAVVDLEEGGRLLAWIGESLEIADVKIGMEVTAKIAGDEEEFYVVFEPAGEGA